MEVKCENLQSDEFSLPNPSSSDEILVPDIGSTVDISENQSEPVCDSPLKVWTGKRAVCSFSANNNDLDDYPFHAVTYGEPGELHGLPYNDHNYAKVCEDEASGDNQLALLAKVALSGKEGNSVTLQRSDSTGKPVSATTEVVSSPVFRNSNVPHVTIIKTPFLNQGYQSSSSLQPTTACKVATTNGRTILLTPNRGNLGASVQIHRVSSVKAPQVLLRTDFNSANDGTVYNGISNSITIRCICGYNRDDGFLIQCNNCKVFQHAECMAPSSNNILPKPYLCELCQPRPVMVSEAVGLQRRKLAISTPQTALAANTIRLTSPSTAFRLPRSSHPTIAPNRFFLTGSATSQNPTSLAVRPIQVRLGETGATLYQVDSTTLNQFSPRFINLDASALTRQPSQPSYVTTAGSQRTSKRKQDLFTLTGESTSTFDNMSNSYSYEESGISNGQHISVSSSNDHTSISNSEGNDLPGPKFYRTPSQTMSSVVGVDNAEGSKVDHFTNCDVTLSCGVPEPNSADVVIRSDSYEKAAETRLSEALKQRIRNIFLSPSERELKTLQMADSFALSRGQQRCRVTSFESRRKGLIATESIFPNQPIIEYKGYAMLMDEYSQQHDYRRRYNPFVLFYKQLDKAVICLDASNYGNEARFIRRSCMPNCEVRLTFPPTDSFSSVVNPQCIQFVITSAVNRVIPVGTELTVGFDFDYTACSYPVRCACGRGPSLCTVADWFRRHRHLSISQHHRIYSDTEEKYGDGDGGGDYEFDNEDEMTGGVENDLYDRNRNRFVGDKPPRNRIPFRRLLNPKRVSPAFSRVPYPSAKHMVQEQQHRRHPNGTAVGGAFPSIVNKRGTGRGGTRGATRGSGRGRGLLPTGLTRPNQPLRAPGRPRGRPPNSGVKRSSVTHRPPLPPPLPPHSENEEEEEEFCRGKNSIASSSPRTDVTEPTSTSPWCFSRSRSPAATTNDDSSSRVRRFSGVDGGGANRKRSFTRNLARIRKPSKMPQSPTHHRPRRHSSTVDSPPSSQIRSPEGDDSVFNERPTSDNVKSPQPKVKRVRKLSGRNLNGLGGSEKGGGGLVSAAKRPRRPSDFGAYDSHIEGQKDQSSKEQSRSNKFREDKWLAEVMRRIERMEKKRSKRISTEKKPKIEKSEEASSVVEPKSELQSPKSPSATDDTEVLMKREGEVVTEGSTKKRRSTVSGASGSGHSGSAAQLSREDRWMQMQLQRIAEMESTETPVDTSVKRRRASSGAKTSGVHHRPSTKKEAGLDSNNSHGIGEGEEECSLIVYKRREQDPMAKFSRSRTAHHHSEQNYLSRSYSLVESFVDEDLPAGGELLDDHATNGGQHSTDGNCPNAPLSVGSSSPPKPSKKRWLSQALMEEDQQHQQTLIVRTTPSPEESFTPPDSSTNAINSQNQRALNPKKRIISQLEEAMANQQRPSPPTSEQVSPSSEALVASSKLPPKKRQSEEESTEAPKVETGNRPVESPPKIKPRPEKVRMSLSEYRRRRGLSTASMESGTANKVSPPQPQSTVPVAAPVAAPSTPPGSPQIDLKRLPTVSELGPPTGGPRTPSEPPSEDEADKSQHPPLSAPASLLFSPHSGNRRESASAERFNTFSTLSPPNSHIRTSPLPNRPPLGGCDRHLSGHAQRRASPPPPPALGSGSETTTPPAFPKNAPPLVEHLLRRDREIIQWQMERQKHSYGTTPTSQTHRRRLSLGHRDYHHHERSGSYQHHHHYSPSSRSHHHHQSSLPPRFDSNSSPGADGNSNSNSVASASAFNHHHHPPHDMEGIRETLMQTREHLQARLRDLQKAAAGGSG